MSSLPMCVTAENCATGSKEEKKNTLTFNGPIGIVRPLRQMSEISSNNNAQRNDLICLNGAISTTNRKHYFIIIYR